MFQQIRSIQWMLIVILALAQAGCGLEHVRVLRESQDEFSRITSGENQSVLQIVTPDGAYLDKLMERNQPLPIDVDKKGQVQQDYFALYQRLDALVKSSKAQLEADNLYPTAASLRVFSLWRATFYYHLLKDSSDRDLSRYQMPSFPDVLAEARALQKSQQLGPRDGYLVEAMEAMMRYEIAYVRYLNLPRNGMQLAQGVNVKEEVVPIVNQMAQAYQTLKQADFRGMENLRHHRSLSCHILLSTAQKITLDSRINIGGNQTTAEYFGLLAPYRTAVDQWNAERLSLLTSRGLLKVPELGLIPNLVAP
jgi:hypothetical protein